MSTDIKPETFKEFDIDIIEYNWTNDIPYTIARKKKFESSHIFKFNLDFK